MVAVEVLVKVQAVVLEATAHPQELLVEVLLLNLLLHLNLEPLIPLRSVLVGPLVRLIMVTALRVETLFLQRSLLQVVVKD